MKRCFYIKVLIFFEGSFDLQKIHAQNTRIIVRYNVMMYDSAAVFVLTTYFAMTSSTEFANLPDNLLHLPHTASRY